MIDKQFLNELVKKVATNEIIKSKSFFIAANWKMNKNTKEVNNFLDLINKEPQSSKNTIALFPPSPYLYLMRDKLRYSKILYGIQNLYSEASGAFTGEVSPNMAKDFGCKYAIIGHSERRSLFFESDKMLSLKVEACLKNGIKPILCIGENLEERSSNRFMDVLKFQLECGLERVKAIKGSDIIIAYEPVWAIGTGHTATPALVEETHNYIRKVLNTIIVDESSKEIPILYGGSVKSSNVLEIALANNVSGFLIGGASLDFNEFKTIADLLEGKN